MSTTRPISDTPSRSLTTAIAYGVTPAKLVGATRITVKLAIVPSPASVTGSHARCWHAGQYSLGGITSSLHLPQRRAVSAPSRAFSKKCLSVITGSVTAEEAHEHGGEVAAERVGQADTGALDLPRPGLAAKLGGDLGDLRGAGRADGMSFRLEPTGRIDGQLAAEGRPALLGGDAARARLEEAEPFRGHDLGDREAVVELHHVDVGGAETGLAVRRGRGALGRRHPGQVLLLVHQHRVRRGGGAEHPDRARPLAGDLLG